VEIGGEQRGIWGGEGEEGWEEGRGDNKKLDVKNSKNLLALSLPLFLLVPF
jgi:hypothetical protein